jgi:hypothetical protein
MYPISIPSSATFSTLPSADVPARGAKAAREFEANLIASLLQSLETTFAALPGEGSLPGTDNYNYLGTHAWAEGIAEHGGFGIAALLSRHFSAHEGKG